MPNKLKTHITINHFAIYHVYFEVRYNIKIRLGLSFVHFSKKLLKRTALTFTVKESTI